MVAVVAATGPSLCADDLLYARYHADEVFCVSNAWELAPWAEHVYAADEDWWRVYGDEVLGGFGGECWTASRRQADLRGLNHVPVDSCKNFSLDFPLASGGNSGFQTVGLAAHLGHRDIVLLGFDMGFSGRKHFFGDHPAKCDRPSNYTRWCKSWERAMPEIARCGVRLRNASRATSLTCVPVCALEDI